MIFIARFFHRPSGATIQRLHIRIRTTDLRSAFWLLMMAAHAPGLIAAWRALLTTGSPADHLRACLFLSISMVFFVLKLRDVRWLRIRADRHSWVAMGMIIALLHTNAIQRHGDDSSTTPYVAVIATTWLAGHMPVIRRTLRRLMSRSSTGLTGLQPVAGPGETIWTESFHPRCWVLALRGLRLRAPPA